MMKFSVQIKRFRILFNIAINSFIKLLRFRNIFKEADMSDELRRVTMFNAALDYFIVKKFLLLAIKIVVKK